MTVVGSAQERGPRYTIFRRMAQLERLMLTPCNDVVVVGQRLGSGTLVGDDRDSQGVSAETC